MQFGGSKKFKVSEKKRNLRSNRQTAKVLDEVLGTSKGAVGLSDGGHE